MFGENMESESEYVSSSAAMLSKDALPPLQEKKPNF
jgi:hypothetical protein